MFPSLVNRPSTFLTPAIFETGVPSELTTGSAYLRSPVTLMLRLAVTVSAVRDASAGLEVELSFPPRKLVMPPLTNRETAGRGFAGSDVSVGTPLYVYELEPDEIVVVLFVKLVRIVVLVLPWVIT